MTTTKLNKKLIKKMIKRIESVPESYDQGTPGESYSRRAAEGRYGGEGYASRPRPEPVCGSVGCLMGQAIICNERSVKKGIQRMYRVLHSGDIRIAAMRLTGLPSYLFGATSRDWPDPYRGQWKNAKTYKGQARAAINLLKAIVATDGKVLEQ